MKKRGTLIAAAVVGGLLYNGSGSAQDWPARPLTMVVAFPAGGSDDILGRIVAARLSELLGQRVNVENVAGAGGMTGTARVARAAPDGYQIALGTSATHAISQVARKNPPYDSIADFTPVALIAEQPFVLVARRDFPANDLQQFRAYARSNDTKMQYGSAGVGSATHLVCALLDAAIGIKARHVPYNGGAPALVDLVDSKIDYFCPVATIAIPQIEKRGVKAVAILSKNRAPILPNLASAAEQGLANFAASTWFAMFLPKGTPEPIVQRLHAALMTTMETPAVQVRFKEIGADMVSPERRSSQFLQSFLKAEVEKWAEAIKAADLKLD
jgi:tripartite-type tricarboxylate transporter receptor subunit TctC